MLRDNALRLDNVFLRPQSLSIASGAPTGGRALGQQRPRWVLIQRVESGWLVRRCYLEVVSERAPLIFESPVIAPRFLLCASYSVKRADLL